jgi:glutathione-regulated potassium-efflux system protein KefB
VWRGASAAKSTTATAGGSGAGTADAVLICIDDKVAATRIAQLLRDEFPLAKVMARAYDRGHAIELIKADVQYQLRETFESALVFGGEAVRLMGATDEQVANSLERVRDFDARRFELQVINGVGASRDLLISNADEQAREQGMAQPPAETEDEQTDEPA